MPLTSLKRHVRSAQFLNRPIHLNLILHLKAKKKKKKSLVEEFCAKCVSPTSSALKPYPPIADQEMQGRQ